METNEAKINSAYVYLKERQAKLRSILKESQTKSVHTFAFQYVLNVCHAGIRPLKFYTDYLNS